MTSPPDSPAGPPKRRPRRLQAQPVTPEMLAGAPEFAPVPRGYSRYDGWTPDRQRAFVKALAETGSVSRAAAWLGMSEVGAYQLRRAPGGEAFARAWAEAQAAGVQKLHDAAFERALYGVAVPIMYHGEQVGERRVYNDRLLSAVLRHHDPEGWGADQQRTRVPPHVVRQLRAEWDAERSEQDASALAELKARLKRMRARMTTPPGPGSSQAEHLAWSLPAPEGGD